MCATLTTSHEPLKRTASEMELDPSETTCYIHNQLIWPQIFRYLDGEYDTASLCWLFHQGF